MATSASGSAGRLGLWLRLGETAEEQLHLVSFAASLGESGAGNERIASCTDLRGHGPANESADRCPKGGYPHGNLQLLAVALPCTRGMPCGTRGGGKGGTDRWMGANGQRRRAHPRRQRLRKR
jgi:hypothetical protein